MKNKLIILNVLFALFTTSVHAGERMGLGLATVSTGVGNSTMITGWIPLGQSTAFQPYLGIPSTAGSFNFLAGTAFKSTVGGTNQNGFHIGGDLILGSLASNFTISFGGLMGLHFTPATSIVFAVDGGPQISIVDGNADFNLGALSSVLGASLIFLF